MDDRYGAMPVLWSVLAGVALVAVIVWCSYLIWRDLRAKAERIVDEAVARRNMAIFEHEIRTPMLGHDPDGACCRTAAAHGDDLRIR